ncbi:transmembrane protein 18 [Polypterus senegalus]|uniref:transmembrane protein 18 n=1 Tax=Polypterus senegalus TaxID=55291 RepID=UPI00196362F7|nr:transmembrane protein 18 [Polypterus senegalus]
MAEAKGKNFTALPEDAIKHLRITSIWTFLFSIEWSEPWLIGLLIGHILCLFVTLVTFRFYRLQILHFLILVGLVYSAEYINEFAAMNWRSFSKYQYFDSNGMFISLIFSVPLLLNTVAIVTVWVYRTFTAMTDLKALQIKRKASKQKKEN